MKRLASIACILVFTAGLATCADQFDSKRAQRDARADTDPNSGFWRGVTAVFAERDVNGKPLPRYKTEIRSRWTQRNVYFLFICPYEQLNLKPEPKTETETNELWKWDVAEAFIGSDFDHIRRYKEFEISPQGEWVDLDIDLDTPRHGNWEWNSKFEASARIDAASKTWYGFMRIPYGAVDTRAARAGNRLRINLYRAQGAGPDKKLIVWQPTQRPSFHVPEWFGTLLLVD